MHNRLRSLVLTTLIASFFVHTEIQAKPSRAKAKSVATKAAKTSPNSAVNIPIKNPPFVVVENQFLSELWALNPDAAIAAGKFDGAAILVVPDNLSRQKTLAFVDNWLQRLEKVDANRITVNQVNDLELMKNYLTSTRWYLTSFRDFEWDPSQYNIAGTLDAILNTDFAPKPQRLAAISQRLLQASAYYNAARSSIQRPTREHTLLAINQSAGTLSVLAEIEKAATDSNLPANDKQTLLIRAAAAKVAVQGYITWLKSVEKGLDPATARSFRIGKDLYEGKFKADIQSDLTAEQTYQRAVVAKEQLHARMDLLADELWPKYMGDQLKPEDRLKKIALVINELAKNHIKREDLFPEVRRQIPLLEDWIVQHDLLNIDRSKPLVVRETPEYERGVSVASIEAPGPYQPAGTTYYNVSPLDAQTPEQAESTLREYNHWVLQILNIHEAVPGHYIQLLHANQSPSLIKSIFGNGAMVEGWAVYSERMMVESGYGGSTPEMWLMYSKWNLRTVCNTILDYQTHVLGLSEEGALDLLMNQAFQTESEAKGKWKRVQYTSVQLTSYFSGFSEIMEFREQQKAVLGDKFNLKQFHEEFLSFGSAPVRMIKKLMRKDSSDGIDSK